MTQITLLNPAAPDTRKLESSGPKPRSAQHIKLWEWKKPSKAPAYKRLAAITFAERRREKLENNFKGIRNPGEPDWA